MGIKQQIQKNQKLIRGLLILLCLIGGAVVVSVGYEMFYARPLVFWIFTGYIAIMVGVAILFGFRLITMFLE